MKYKLRNSIGYILDKIFSFDINHPILTQIILYLILYPLAIMLGIWLGNIITNAIFWFSTKPIINTNSY